MSLLGRQDRADCLVLEVSSFQLDTAPSFHPQTAALLNITPDHLDRYADYAAYTASKASVFRAMTLEETKVLNYDDPLVRPLGLGLGNVRYFSAIEPLSEGAWLADGAIKISLAPAEESEFPLADIRLQGTHNLENIMAALLLALTAGANGRGLPRGSGLLHRPAPPPGMGGHPGRRGLLRRLQGHQRRRRGPLPHLL